MLKKITSLITTAAFVMTSVGAIASDKTDVEYFLEENFDSFKSSWTVKGDTVSLSAVPGNANGDKSLKIEAYKKEQICVSIPIEKIDTSFTVDFNLRHELLKNDVTVAFSNSSGEAVGAFSALTGGSFALYDSQGEVTKVYTCEKGQWNNIALGINPENGKVSLYVNGKHIADADVSLANSEITSIDFTMNGSDGNSDAAFIDDLRIYSESVPLKSFTVKKSPAYSTVALSQPQGGSSSVNEAYNGIEMLAFFNFNSDTDEKKGPAKWNSNYNNAFIGCVEDTKGYGRSVKLMSPAANQSPILTLDTADVAYYNISAEAVGDYVMDFDVKFSDITSLRFFGLYTNNANAIIQLWRTTNAGNIAALGKKNVWSADAFVPNKWYNTQTVIKVVDGKYTTFDVYFDGKLIGKDMELNGTPFSRMNSVRINQGASEGETAMLIDNFKIYPGSEPVEIDPEMYEVEEKETSQEDIVAEKAYPTCFAFDEDLKEPFKDYILLHNGYSNAVVYGEKKRIDEGNENVKVFVENGRTYVPLRFLSEAMGAVVTYIPESRSVLVKFEEKELRFTADSYEFYVNGVKEYTDSPVILREDRIFVPIRAVTESIDKSIKYLDTGSVIIGPYKDKFKTINEPLKHTTVLAQAERLMYFNRPSAEKILQDYRKMGSVHPSINATASDFDRILQLASTDKFVKDEYEKFIKSADNLLETPVAEYKIAGSNANILNISRQTISRGETLGLAFLTTKEEKYKDRLWEEIQAVCAFENWNPENNLANSEMVYAVSVAYDWLYHYWTDEQKQFMEKAVMEKSLEYYLDLYRNDRSTSWFAYIMNNQTSCSNSCYFMAAIAFMDAFPEKCSELAGYAVQAVEYALGCYAPDGGYMEGPGYWDYGTKYLTYFLQTAENALGSDYGYFDNAPGFKDTYYYITNMTGTTATFNWADASEIFVQCASLMYAAKRLDDAALMNWRVQNVKRAETVAIVQDILWYDPEVLAGEHKLPLDDYYTEIVSGSFRSAWNDPNANYIGFHAGSNRDNHGQLDMGSFVIESEGVRWAKELGMEDYVTGYFDTEYWRWTFYRARAEGQNTIALNPTQDPDQDPLADKAVMESFVSKPKGGFAVIDMTSAYCEDAVKARRGFMLSENRKVFTVRDEVELTEKGELYWFMHTTQKIEIAPDGRSATIISGAKKLYIKLLSDNPDLKFSAMEAVSLPSSYKNELQKPNNGIRKLVIYAKGIKEFNASVVMSTDEKAFSKVNSDTKLDDWSIPDGEIVSPVLSGMKIDGVLYDDFQPQMREYNLYMPSGSRNVPQIEAIADYPVTVEQAKTIQDKTYITVYEKNDLENCVVYTVNYWEDALIGKPVESEQIEVVAYEASNITTKPSSYAFDKNTATYWTSPGPASMTMDLGEVKDVSSLAVRWLAGSRLRFYYKVETSLDGKDWKCVFNGISSGATEEFETTPFETHQARFVKITSFKNNTSENISHTELEVYGKVW